MPEYMSVHAGTSPPILGFMAYILSRVQIIFVFAQPSSMGEMDCAQI